jgi:hypothetical protein
MTAMQITDAPNSLCSAILTPTAKSLRLRVGHPDGSTENVLLESAKITIGSAQGCNLRMDSPGLRPVHCMILRGATGVVVRGWQGPVNVNGAAVEACRVDAGDRLQLGAVTITFLDEPTAEKSPRRTKTKRRKITPSTRRTDRSSEVRSLQRIRLRLRRRLRESEAKQREMLKKWRTERRNWLTKFQGEEARFAELEQKTFSWHQALEHQQAALRQEFQQWQARQSEAPSMSNPSPRIQELQKLQEELESARAAWEAERAAQAETIKARRRLRLSRLRRATFELRRQLKDLAARSNTLQQERDQWEATKAAFEAQRLEERLSRDHDQATLHREAARLQSIELELAQRRNDLEESLRECTEQRNQLERDRSEFAADFADSDARIRSEIVGHETAYASLMDHVRELESELAQLRSAQPLGEPEPTTEKWEINPAATQRLEELESELTLAHQTIQELQETIANLSVEMESAHQKLGEIDRLSSQVDQLLAQLAESESRHSQEMREQSTSWEAEKLQWVAERSALQAEWKSREEELCAEKQLLQAKSDRLTAELAESRGELERIQESLQHLASNADSQSQHTHETLGILQASLADAQARCGELEQQLGLAHAELDQRSAQLQEAIAVIEQAASTNQDDLHGEFAAQLENIDQQISQERLQWQARVDELEHQLAALNSLGETWEYEKSELVEAHAERIQQLENHILALQSEIDTLAANTPPEPLPFAGSSPCIKREEVTPDEQDLITALLRKGNGNDYPKKSTIVEDNPPVENVADNNDAAEILARYGFDVSSNTPRRNLQDEQVEEVPSDPQDLAEEAVADGDYATQEVAEQSPLCDEELDDPSACDSDDESSANHEKDGDEAITDYMQRLLQRVGNKKSNGPTTEPAKVTPPEPVAPPPQAPKTSQSPVTTSASTELESLTLPPKRVKAEPAANLDAMRALANATTRSAIQTHQVVKEKMKIFLNLGLTVIVVLLATMAMILGRAKMPILFYFGAATIPIALIFGWQTLRGVFRARSLKRTTERKPTAPATEENELLPIPKKSPNSDDFLGALHAPLNE